MGRWAILYLAADKFSCNGSTIRREHHRQVGVGRAISVHNVELFVQRLLLWGSSADIEADKAFIGVVLKFKALSAVLWL